MFRVHVYDENGHTGKYYGIDCQDDLEWGTALNRALDRMVAQEELEMGHSTAIMRGYLYPVYSADYTDEGAERGYVAAADSPGYRHVTWEVRED